MKKRKNTKASVLLIAFSLGLLLACFLPPRCLVVVLAAVVICLGIYTAKCC